MSAELKWYGGKVTAAIKDATDASLRKLALDVEALTKDKITANGQVVTGFMRNSVYTVTKEGVTGGVSSTTSTGEDGKIVKRESVPPADLGDADAIVGVGAVYAIYQELKNSFLRVSFEQVVGTAEVVIAEEFQQKLSE